MSLEVEHLTFEILKNSFGVKILQFKVDNLFLKQIKKLHNSIIAVKATIGVDYFNKRKITYEPLLEPWEFTLK